MAIAKGNPTRSALVVAIQTALPAAFPPQNAQLVEVDQVSAIRRRVVGETMSLLGERLVLWSVGCKRPLEVLLIFEIVAQGVGIC